jgi:hypothetical protein
MQNSQDELLLEAFHLMDEEERSFHLEVFLAQTAGRCAKRPELRLVITRPAPLLVESALSRCAG